MRRLACTCCTTAENPVVLRALPAIAVGWWSLDLLRLDIFLDAGGGVGAGGFVLERVLLDGGPLRMLVDTAVSRRRCRAVSRFGLAPLLAPLRYMARALPPSVVDACPHSELAAPQPSKPAAHILNAFGDASRWMAPSEGSASPAWWWGCGHCRLPPPHARPALPAGENGARQCRGRRCQLP